MDYYSYWNSQNSKGPKKHLINDLPGEDITWIIDAISELKVKTLLDIGCGKGRLFPLWRNLGFKATGYEWSEVIYPFTEYNGKNYGIKTKKIDIRNIKSDETFDIVFSTQVLLHIPPADIAKVFSNMVQLSNRYIIIITGFNPDNIARQDATYFDGTYANSFSHSYYSIFDNFKLDIVKDSEIAFSNGKTNKGWVLKK